MVQAACPRNVLARQQHALLPVSCSPLLTMLLLLLLLLLLLQLHQPRCAGARVQGAEGPFVASMGGCARMDADAWSLLRSPYTLQEAQEIQHLLELVMDPEEHPGALDMAKTRSSALA